MNTPAILVVDDDPSVHELLGAVLSPQHWRLESAYDGEDALLRLRSNGYDLVITDIRMPGMSGLDLLRQVRLLKPELKVMVMTAESTPNDVISAIREHAFTYFRKPFSPGAVAEMITQALNTPAWEDDIQVVSARPEWITLRVRCRPETADRLLQFLREMDMDLPAKPREDIASAFRELLLNAIEHGGGSDPNKIVRVSYLRTNQALIYYIQDPGQGFSMDQLPHAAISNPPGDPARHIEIREEMGVRPGGFGILLTRHLVDELIYNERGNEVLFIKYLRQGTGNGDQRAGL